MRLRTPAGFTIEYRDHGSPEWVVFRGCGCSGIVVATRRRRWRAWVDALIASRGGYDGSHR